MESKALDKERRFKSRFPMVSSIHYRTPEIMHFEKGLLHNLSQTGAFFSGYCDIDVNTAIHVVVASEHTDQAPIQIIAKVIRKEHLFGRFPKFGYGCRLQQMHDPNHD